MNRFKSFFIALQFMTRLPSPNYSELDPQDIGQSVLYYPLIGLIIGFILASSVTFLSFLSPSVLAITILALSVLINGALHLDGLADSADAWLSGADKEKALKIMRDPHLGTAGVVSIVLLLLLKYVFLVEALSQDHIYILLLIPVFARTSSLILMLSLPYARHQGIAENMHHSLPKKPALTIVIVITLISLWFNPIAFIMTAIMLIFIRRLIRKRLDGYTGDTLGATIELTELCYLFGFIISINVSP